MPEFKVLSRTPSAYVNEKRQLVESTFVVYQDKDGHVGTIVIPKAGPTDAEIEDAVKKRAAAR